jgi:hypothetical protein
MKIGTPLADLAERILTESKSKRDFVADTRKLRLEEDGTFTVGEIGRSFKPTKLCLEQVAGRTGIPAKYAERMRTEAPALLSRNVNHWFDANPEKRLVRTLDNGGKVARAFLSERYRPLDNYDLAEVILPKLSASGCVVKSCEMTERRFYIQAVTERVSGEVKKGDVVQAGIVITNSEVGCGAIKIEPLIYRLACLNGMISASSLRKNHVGRAGEGSVDGDDSFEMFSDKTRQLDDKAFWAKVCDVTDASLSQLRFDETVAKLRLAADKQVGNPVDAVEVVTRKLELTEGESKSVLTHLASGSDLSLWGLANAVTRTAEDSDDYDRAIELERAGSYVLELKPTDFGLN